MVVVPLLSEVDAMGAVHCQHQEPVVVLKDKENELAFNKKLKDLEKEELTASKVEDYDRAQSTALRLDEEIQKECVRLTVLKETCVQLEEYEEAKQINRRIPR